MNRRFWWSAYGLCAAAVLVSLLWVSRLVVDLEEREGRALAELAHASNVQEAMWRMESWLAPLLAGEAARPHFEYRPYYEASGANYTNLLNEIPEGAFHSRSPLLTFHSDLLPLHFQVSEEGFSSPQVPEGNWRDLAEATCLPGTVITDNQAVLDGLASALTPTLCGVAVTEAEERIEQLLGDDRIGDYLEASNQSATKEAWTTETKKNRGKSDLSARAQSAQQVFDQNAANSKKYGAPQILQTEELDLEQLEARFTVEVGPLVPVWIRTDGPSPDLVYLRRVTLDETQVFQGFLTDWPELRDRLVERAEEVLPGTRLHPAPEIDFDAVEDDLYLAAIPVRVETPPAPIPETSSFTPARITLLLAWLAMGSAVVAVGVTLRSSIAFGEKRSRFASSVTHELRTPLTTFRMYSEMLADGMVPDETKRMEYLETLKRESGRLARLVENVLSYARLEEGRGLGNPEELRVSELLARVSPTLADRCRDCGMAWSVESEVGEDTRLHVDVEAVGQILFNLVDNACKYAREVETPSVRLEARGDGERVVLRICDRGPGIPEEQLRAVFAPFDRGGRDSADPAPGIGLGLALARGLARDLGGDLRGVPSAEGACFELELPRGAAER